jgi:hypothetical protein
MVTRNVQSVVRRFQKCRTLYVVLPFMNAVTISEYTASSSLKKSNKTNNGSKISFVIRTTSASDAG